MLHRVLKVERLTENQTFVDGVERVKIWLIISVQFSVLVYSAPVIAVY